jgi:CheY-like chemotaxis protein
MTANGAQTDQDACLAAGMDRFLPKPFKALDLERVIERVTAGAIQQPDLKLRRADHGNRVADAPRVEIAVERFRILLDAIGEHGMRDVLNFLEAEVIADLARLKRAALRKDGQSFQVTQRSLWISLSAAGFSIARHDGPMPLPTTGAQNLLDDLEGAIQAKLSEARSLVAASGPGVH